MDARKKCLRFEGGDEIAGVLEGGVTLEMCKLKRAGCLSGGGFVLRRWLEPEKMTSRSLLLTKKLMYSFKGA